MNKRLTPVSVILPARNVATTIEKTLASLARQTYPIREIIVIDNVSTDGTGALVVRYARKIRIPIRLITKKKSQALGTSCNEGVRIARSSIIILMHPDCSLRSSSELTRLIRPLQDDASAVAAYPTIDLRRSLWRRYGFWQKLFFAREVGRGAAGLTGKFDAIQKKIYLRVGGFDTKNFGVGGEDAHLSDTLVKHGLIVKSGAVVTHMHYLGDDYSFARLLIKTRAYARAYGRLIRERGVGLINNGMILLVKPFISIMVFIPGLHILGAVLIFLFSFFYTKQMFTDGRARNDSRIALVPFINVFLLYYETFWIVESFLFGKNKIE